METAKRNAIADKLRTKPELKDWEIAKLLRRRGVTAADVTEVRSEAAPAQQGEDKPAPRPRVRSLADFRKAHDIPQKIRDTLADMRKDGYVTEEELRHLCEVPVQSWRRNAELPEFAPHKFKLDGVTYWGSPETIKAMKQITGRA